MVAGKTYFCDKSCRKKNLVKDLKAPNNAEYIKLV